MDNIKINSATSDQIATLYDIGPELAKRIVQYRNAHGYFYTPDDLAKVSGISLDLSHTLSPHINWEIPSEPTKKGDYITFLVSIMGFLGSIYLIYYRRIPDLSYRIGKYYEGVHGGIIWVFIQLCLLLTSLIACFLCLIWAISSITKSRKLENRLVKVNFILIISLVFDLILLVLLNAIFYQYFSPDGWTSFLMDKINLTSAMLALALGMTVGILVLFNWKPLLLSNNLLKRTIDIALLLMGTAMALTTLSGSNIFPIWLLVSELLFGLFAIIIGWLSVRKGHFFTDTLIDLFLADFSKNADESSVNWQSWINTRLPNPADQQALRDTLMKTYPPSKLNSIFSILFIGVGSWIVITILASIIDWVVQHFLNSWWTLSFP